MMQLISRSISQEKTGEWVFLSFVDKHFGRQILVEKPLEANINI